MDLATQMKQLMICNIMLLYYIVDCHVDHKGMDFVTAFLHLDTTLGPEILLIPQVPEQVNVSVRTSSSPYVEPINVQIPAGSSRLVTMPSSVRMNPGYIESKGIEITATNDIVVYSINKSPDSNDAILVLPSDALGKDYVIPSYTPGINYITNIGLVAAYNNTVIEVLLNGNKSVRVNFRNKTYKNHDLFTMELQEYETIQLESENDLSGLKITSNKSFAIIIGSSRKDIHGSGNNTEHIEEQVIPSNAWGTTFIALPFSVNGTPDLFKITSSCDNTSVEIKTPDINTVYHLQTSESVQVELKNNNCNDYICITSNKPVSVLQYYCSPKTNVTDSIKPVKCDSYLVTIPPLEQQEQEYVYSTLSNISNETHAITLVINSTLSEGLLIDDQPSASFQDNDTLISLEIDGYDSNFTAMRLHIPSGYHNITHKDKGTPFSAISHASPIGMSMVDLTNGNNKKEKLPTYNLQPKEEEIIKSNSNSIQLMETSTSDDGSGNLPANVIAVIVTLTSAIFFVIVCILGFVLTETVCRRGVGKVSPYNVS